MWLVLILIPALGISAFLVKTGWLAELDGPVELGSFIFGIILFASISFIAFRCRVWSGDFRAMFRGRSASFNAGPSSFQGVCSSAQAFFKLFGILVTIVVTALEFEGRHDVVVQFLVYMAGKLSKLVAFLLQP